MKEMPTEIVHHPDSKFAERYSGGQEKTAEEAARQTGGRPYIPSRPLGLITRAAADDVTQEERELTEDIVRAACLRRHGTCPA